MEPKDLKRGMRITLRGGKVEVVDKVSFESKGFEPQRLYPIGDGDYYDSFDNNLKNMFGDWDIMKVEDLDSKGSYYTIWERKEPKYYILPKGIEATFEDVLNYDPSISKWKFCTKEEDEYGKTQFTIEEMIELGLDPDNFDKELVCSK